MALWGVDLGGTKIEAVVLKEANHDAVICRKRIDTEAAKGPAHIVARVALLLDLVAAECGERPRVIGLGHPGTVDPQSSLLCNSNTQCLNQQPLQELLEQRLNIPVVMENDANCFALAEAVFGAAIDCAVVFGVILGTGVGGGIVVRRHVLHGMQGIAGEWGHNVLLPDGPQCYCGKRGCVETLVSGPALEQLYAHKTGAQLALTAISQRAENESDVAAKEVLQQLHDCFGKTIATVVNVLDPDCIVLGGGVSNIPSLYDIGVSEALKHIFHPQPRLNIVRNKLGDSAGVFGAALLTTQDGIRRW